jgi:hypothetical protein
MNSLFGDATSVMPTPEVIAEAELFLSGNRSPVPSLDINGRRPHGFTSDNAIPGLDIDPPRRPNLGSRQGSSARSVSGEGVGGWISNMVARARGQSESNGEHRSQYSRVGQGEEDDIA